MSTVSVRYIVDDVDAAIPFYCEHLGFHEDMHPDPAFAMLSRGDLRLVLVSPIGPDHRAAVRVPCLMGPGRNREDGIGSCWKSQTLPARWTYCERRGFVFATTS
jgi:catechol 2,3-dioxygenase-like lactoylglutathione lyase family enzyme